jgi:hypothetical protein
MHIGLSKPQKPRPDTVAHTQNPSYSGKWKLGELWLAANPGQKVSETPSQPINLDMVVRVCDPSYARDIRVQASLGKNARHYSKNT